MPKSAKSPIPEGLHTVTPHLVIRDAAKAIEFYKKALGAEEISRFAMPDGKIGHAELKIGDSHIFLGDEMPNPGNAKSPQSAGSSTITLNIYVPDVDAAFKKAIAAGGKETMPVADQFWGDRYGAFTDPFGHTWSIGTRKLELTQEEMGQRAREFFSQAQAQRKTA